MANKMQLNTYKSVCDSGRSGAHLEGPHYPQSGKIEAERMAKDDPSEAIWWSGECDLRAGPTGLATHRPPIACPRSDHHPPDHHPPTRRNRCKRRV